MGAGAAMRAVKDVPMMPLGDAQATALPDASVSASSTSESVEPLAALPAPGTTEDPRAANVSKVLVAGGTGGVGRCASFSSPLSHYNVGPIESERLS